MIMQKTITRSFPLEGIGLHSGQPVRLLIHPAPPDSGITLVKDGQNIPATLAALDGTSRNTSLSGIATVEHFLSAAYGLGLDNLRVEIEGEEFPAVDGSSLPFVNALLAAGISEQGKAKNYFSLTAPIQINDGPSQIEALPFRGFAVEFMVNFEGFGEQILTFNAEKDSYLKEIAPARTFGYLEEYEGLKSRGLAIGASYENALVLSKQGPVNQPRFPDEIVRHKILDLIGDLALLGRPLQAQIRAVRSGHKLNAELIRRILNNG